MFITKSRELAEGKINVLDQLNEVEVDEKGVKDILSSLCEVYETLQDNEVSLKKKKEMIELELQERVKRNKEDLDKMLLEAEKDLDRLDKVFEEVLGTFDTTR